MKTFALALATATILALGIALTAGAQDIEPSTAGKLAIHGFLSAGYAWSSDVQVLGIPTTGTSSYRNLALQLSYAMNERSRFVVQLSNEQEGVSPINDFHDDVELDWGFFDHRFDDGLGLRVGRVPLPFGIYNEIRDVGTVLEFYRPPVNVYFEGAFSNEAVDGAVLSYTFFADSSWSLETDLFYGEWSRIEASLVAVGFFEGRAEDAMGTQLWLNTPVSGLRFGLALQHFEFTGGLPSRRRTIPEPQTSYLFSIDYSHERFSFRSELNQSAVRSKTTTDVDSTAYYVQLGYHFSDGWSVHGQYEERTLEVLGLPVHLELLFYEDASMVLAYRFSPNLIVRLEGHHARTNLVEEIPKGGLPAETDYGIASLSVSF